MKDDVRKKVDTIFKEFSQRKYDSGEVIVSAGDKIDTLYYLNQGSIKQYAISNSGDEIMIHIFRAPAVIPMMLILSKKKTEYYFEVVEKSTIISAPTDKVLPLLTSDLEFTLDLLERFSSAIHGLTQRVITLTSQKQKGQLLELLRYLASKNTKEVSQNQVPADITHTRLASWLGCARETVSRILKELEKEKLITRDGNTITVKP